MINHDKSIAVWITTVYTLLWLLPETYGRPPPENLEAALLGSNLALENWNEYWYGTQTCINLT